MTILCEEEFKERSGGFGRRIADRAYKMKRRLLTIAAVLLLCVSLFLGIGGARDAFTVTSYAASNTQMLQKLYDKIPPQSTWSTTYISTSSLELYYSQATNILSNPDKYADDDFQDYIDLVTAGLNDAYSSLEYHTLGINITKDSVNLKVGASATLKTEITPEKGADEITWKSSSKAVSVTDKGVIKAEKYTSDKVIITATSNGHSDTCKVTVTNQLDSLTLSNDSKVTYKGMTFTLKPTVKGKDTSAPVSDPVVYFWDSSNPAVCTVNEDGKVTALGKGTATIICTAKAGSVSKTASCVVSVGDLIEVTGFSPEFTTVNGAITMIVGESETLKVNITPANATIRVLKWTSSNTSVLRVDSSSTTSATSTAKISALKVGTAKLTYAATDGSGKSGKVTVNVLPQVSSLTLSSTRLIIAPGNSKVLTAKISPADAGNQVLSWTSDNEEVATVSSTGKITAKNNGVCTITAKSTDGSNVAAACSVRVVQSAKSIRFEESSAVVKVGEKLTLKPIVTTTLDKTYNDFVSWKTSDKTVATISSAGVVTGKAPGLVTITATTMDGTNLSATATVRVVQPVTGVTCAASKSLEKNSSFTLNPTVTPSNATNKSLKFSSSDETIATVSSTGVVTSKAKVGTCTITVKTVDGGFKAKCKVSVLTKTTAIKLNASSKTLAAGKTYTLKATVSPSTATDKTVKWSSSDKKVATVGSDGLVKAVAGGSCTITAKASGGQTAVCKISVTQGISTLTLAKTSLSLYKGQVYTLKKTVKPTTTTVTKYTWTSSNESIAKVNSSGVITAKGIGSCTIKCKADGKTASCKVTVTKPVKAAGVYMDLREISVAAGKTYTLKAKFTPSNTSVKTVTWKSSNTKIATVSDKGVVTGVKAGNCIVTCTSKDGGYTASCRVSVDVPVTGIRFVTTEYTVSPGSSKTLKCTFYPSNASDKTLVWTSSDPKIAKVNSNGKVTGVKKGTVTITAKTPDGKFTAKTTVKVFVEVTGVKLEKTSIKMEKGDSYCLVAGVRPTNASNKKVKWSSNNKSVATVTDGVITALKTGNAVITCTTKDGGFTATCRVKVIQPVTNVNIQYTSLNLNVGVSRTVTAYVRPVTATNKNVVWSTSDKKVATVSTVGKVKAVGPGSCVITCKSADGYSKATMKVKVVQPPKGIVLDKSSLYVPIKGSKTLTAKVKPKNTTNKTVLWSTNNTEVATVDSKGNITAKGLGSCTIIAKTYDGAYSAECKVTVFTPVSSLKLNVKSTYINVGEKVTLIPTIKPSNAYFKTVKWSSNNNDVATVNAEGEITAKSPGYAVITAKSKDGACKATCSVNVVQPVKGVKLSVSTLEMDVDEVLTLKAKVKPSNASNPTVKWSSSNADVVKVNSAGKLTALKLGSAVITVKTVDGGYKATVKVKVIHKVHSVTLSQKSCTVYIEEPFKLTATVLPSNATTKTVTWVSSDQSVCVVSSSGKVTPLKAGKAVIAAVSTQGGIKGKCVVTVENPAKKLTLSNKSATLTVGDKLSLTATVGPANTTNKKVTWVSSDPSVAVVNSKGVVTAKAEGKAVITATTSNGISKTCTVTVRE